MTNFYDPRYKMYPTGNLNYLAQMPSMGGQSFLQALHAQSQLQQFQANRENQQQTPTSSASRQQTQQIPTTAAQNQAMLQQQQAIALLTLQNQLSQQQEQQNKNLLSQQNLQSILGMNPQQIQLLQSQLQSSTPNASRPSLMSNFPVQNNASQLNVNNLIKQEPKQMYGLTAGVPYRSAANNLSVPGTSMIRTPEVNTSPAPNRANNLLSNIHAAQPSHHLLIDGPTKQERQNVRDRIEKASEEQKQIESQLTTASKRRQHLIQVLENRKIEMRREHEEAQAEAAAAILRASANAEASKSKVPLIDQIAMENRQQTEKNDPPLKLLPVGNKCHNSKAITNNYKKLAPMLIRTMVESKLKAQKERDEYLVNYEEKYLTWLRRVEKYEKTPKKIAKDQKNRELFEKTFPEIKKDREERERNERHERNNGDEIPKSKEEKAAERACHVPFYCPQKPRHSFENMNNIIDDQELKSANDNISTFLSHWSPAERSVFINKIKSYWKNFHVLSHFYWDKSCCDMVKFFYATKTEVKYKLTFPKAKKKVAKAYKPTPMPDFREMYDHLMATCDLKNTFQKLSCLICSNDVHLFGEILPRMRPEKEKLKRKIAREQEYREKMPICNKCYSTYKKPSIRCPVGDCGNGRRRNKPSRALPPEFVELPVEEQSLIVRKLQFHPATPKICANCHKRIVNEVKNIKAGTFTYDASLDSRRSSVNKKQLNWTFDKVEALFNAAADPNKNWDVISSQLCVENFKPSARQCRLVHTKLSNFWQIKKRRVYLETASRRLRKMYRGIKRAAKIEYGHNRKQQFFTNKKSVSKAPTSLRSPIQNAQHGSITQGIPVSRTPTTTSSITNLLLSNFASEPSTSTLSSSLNQSGLHSQLQDEKLKHFLIEALGISKENPAENNVTEIMRRIHLMSPYDFEKLSNQLKARSQTEQDAAKQLQQLNQQHFENQPKEQNLRTTQSPRSSNQLDSSQLPVTTATSSALQFSNAKAAETTVEDTTRQTASADRPSRKTGLANMMFDSNNSGGFRSRTHTLQKNTINRPSSAIDTQQQQQTVLKVPKTEPVETLPENEDPKTKQSKQSTNGARQSTPATSGNEEPAYESLSDDDDTGTPKTKQPETSSSTKSQKPSWRQLLTIFNLEEHEHSQFTACPSNFKMPPIEKLSVSTPYEDLSD